MSITIIGINNEENRVLAKRPLKEVLEQIETTEGMELHTSDEADGEYVVKVGDEYPDYFYLVWMQEAEDAERCVCGATVYGANSGDVCEDFILEFVGCEETITEHDEDFFSLMGLEDDEDEDEDE